jgi:hypothetical protein
MFWTISAGITTWWPSYYGNHQLASVAVRFLHLAGVLMAGGTGLFVDRQVLDAIRAGTQERENALVILGRTHIRVLSWMALIALTGVLMTAADAETFLPSKLYWLKMALVLLLLLNGAAMYLAGRRSRRIGIDSGWPRLAATSAISAVLWLITMFLGTLLTVAA